MKSGVCTLFEGNYHQGVAALINSLHRSNFNGCVYAGYRGELPQWARNGSFDAEKKKSAQMFSISVTEKITAQFFSLDTKGHLTNYKPDFMLDLVAGPASDVESLFYFDPDIVINEKWSFFEQWVSCGIALCEDINSPLPQNHPRRIGWRRFYAEHGFNLCFKGCELVNGGCQGIRREDIGFLETWRDLQNLMFEEIGGASVAGISGGASFNATQGFANCFDRTDQDALNAAVEATDLTLTVLGKEAMAFTPGAAILPHALGRSKPWTANYMQRATAGRPPRLVDKLFWNNVQAPIHLKSRWMTIGIQLSIRIAAFMGRFYSRQGD